MILPFSDGQFRLGGGGGGGLCTQVLYTNAPLHSVLLQRPTRSSCIHVADVVASHSPQPIQY